VRTPDRLCAVFGL